MDDDGGGGRPDAERRQADGRGHRVLGQRVQARRDAQHLRCGQRSQRHRVGQCRATVSQRAGLVKAADVDLARDVHPAGGDTEDA